MQVNKMRVEKYTAYALLKKIKADWSIQNLILPLLVQVLHYWNSIDSMRATPDFHWWVENQAYTGFALWSHMSFFNGQLWIISEEVSIAFQCTQVNLQLSTL